MRDPIGKKIKNNRHRLSLPGNLLHGIKLEQIVTRLQAYYGWQQLAQVINISCF